MRWIGLGCALLCFATMTGCDDEDDGTNRDGGIQNEAGIPQPRQAPVIDGASPALDGSDTD